MAELEKPEPKAVAWLLDWGVGFKGREVTLDAERAQRWECVGNCTVTALYPDLPAAQALLAERDARIKELEAKLARLRPIIRAASRWAYGLIGSAQGLADALDALSPEERAEILSEGGKDG